MLRQVITVLFLVAVSSAFDLQIVNNAPKSVFVQMEGTTGDKLTIAANDNLTLHLPQPWTGYIYGRTDCADLVECLEPIPNTLVEITVGDGYGFYDISLIDGFNLPVSIAPNSDSCDEIQCEYPILEDCPEDLKLKNDDGDTIACKAACSPETDCDENNVDWYREKCPLTLIAPTDTDTVFDCDTSSYVVTFL